VRDAVLADPDPETRALFLGKSVSEYGEWIMNPHHWGGESEIVVLAEYFKVEVAIVSCEMMATLVYGEGAAGGRIYVLYTGSHYDPLVTAATPDAMPKDERKIQPCGRNSELESQAFAIAKQHIEEAARKAAQKTVKKIKCGGCGALLDSNEAFQEHCMDETVMHDDDFAYDCSEIEVVFEEGDALPDFTVDLTDEAKVCPFYNSATYHFSNVFPVSIELDSVSYPSAEHAWQSLKFVGSAPDIAKKIREAKTVDLALTISNTEGIDKVRADWSGVRYETMLRVLRAKFQQHPDLRGRLLETGDRLLVNVDIDKWAGMSATGGIATGENSMGKALMQVRSELRA
jgi:ribA/ribD-fused uncharacterized protein